MWCWWSSLYQRWWLVLGYPLPPLFPPCLCPLPDYFDLESLFTPRPNLRCASWLSLRMSVPLLSSWWLRYPKKIDCIGGRPEIRIKDITVCRVLTICHCQSLNEVDCFLKMEGKTTGVSYRMPRGVFVLSLWHTNTVNFYLVGTKPLKTLAFFFCHWIKPEIVTDSLKGSNSSFIN